MDIFYLILSWDQVTGKLPSYYRMIQVLELVNNHQFFSTQQLNSDRYIVVLQ